MADSIILQLASELMKQHVPCALCTVIKTSGSVPRHPGSKMLVSQDGGVVSGTIGGGAMESRVCEIAQSLIVSGKASTVKYQLSDPKSGDPGVCGGEVEVFIDPLLPTPILLIIGAGHVGRALTHLAKWSGFHVVVTDDRADLCSPKQCPEADDYICESITVALQRVPLTAQTYVALVTRGYPIDVEILPFLIQSPVRYIGVIGSRRRWVTTSKALLDRGISEADIARIHAPIGIEIAAETPEEIAVSIMAEVIGVYRS